MQLDQGHVQPQNVETPVVSGENNVDRPLETEVTPEIVADAIPAAPVQVDPAPTPVLSSDAVATQDDSTAATADAVVGDTSPVQVELDDTKELKGDDQYISAIKKVIQEDAEEPFREEQDSEKLQKSYLNERFGVDVDIEEGAK